RNYYLARANPLEQNIRVYRVEKGVRHLLQNFDQTIDVRHWHTLRVTHQGCRVNVFYDDKQVFDLCDKTFHDGMIGLWTKSDAISGSPFPASSPRRRCSATSPTCRPTCTTSSNIKTLQSRPSA